MARKAAIAAGMDPDALEKEKEEQAALEAEMEREDARLAHVESAHGTIAGCLSCQTRLQDSMT